MESIYKKNLSFRVRRIAKQSVLFGEGLKAYNLNETGVFIWNHINGDSSIKEIKNALIENYEGVDDEMILKDLFAFIDFLNNIGAIERF